MAHLITGNKFDPNEDIPDLNGKVPTDPRSQIASSIDSSC